MTIVRLLIVAAAVAGAAPAVAADDAASYPDRTIHLVTPMAAGIADVIPRMLGAKLAAQVGQPVVIDNRPGASFNIASDYVAKAPADGYTILYSTSSITLLPQILGPTAVDPAKAFTPVAKVLTIPVIIVANPKLGAKTLDDVVALARRQPGSVSYATPGVGSLPHLVTTLVARRAGVELVHVPYTNIGQAVQNVLGGEVPLFVTWYSQVDAHLRSGALVPIAVASTNRTPWLPGVPTTVELGYPDATVEPWSGIFVPAGTPAAIVRRLNREFNAMLQSPDIRERYAQLGLEPVLDSTPESFAADVRAQLARWPAIVKAAGLKPE